MTDLINKIQNAQIQAGEDAVIAHLESLGLIKNPTEQARSE